MFISNHTELTVGFKKIKFYNFQASAPHRKVVSLTHCRVKKMWWRPKKQLTIPMRSMPARLSGVWLGSWSEPGASTRYISALAVSRVIVVPRAGSTLPSDPLD